MMIVLLLCVIMKIAEFSAGRVSPTLQSSRQKQRQRKKPPPLQLLQQQQQQKQQHEQQKSPTSMSCRLRQDWNYYRIPCDKCMYFLRRQCAGKGAAVMEDPQTPGSDCNSNPATDSMQQDLIGSDFIQDNVEYQWCTDYGYRDGGLHVHPSVLSTLSASYTREDVGYYDDLSRNLDANLAEIDMESFRSADIHTLLTALPVMCTDPVQHSEFNYQRERYASISSSVMEKLDIGSSISPHTSSQGEESACSTTDTMSICKSSLLFSPVKETPVLPPAGSYSVDSLDCEDMLLTCQANNKNNYTIAFEASITMYSDSSPDFEHQEKPETYEVPEIYYKRKSLRRNILDSSMACSDSKIYTTWSNLKHTSMNKVITRHPSGNNNTIPNFLHGTGNTITSINNKRSQSLPDLSRIQESPANIHLNFSVDSAESNNHPLQSNNSGSAMSRSVNEENSDGSGNNCCGKKLQNLSLVKLFMKQKSMSAEGMSLTLDQSDSISDNGWPTSNSASDSATANTNTQIQRQNLNNTCTRPLPEKDFSINWVRSDCYTNKEIESQKDKFADIPNNFSSNKENKDGMISSASVEELSESIVKSELVHDSDIEQIDFEISQDDLESRGKNVRVLQAENKCTIVKTTGIQAMVETEDNEVQTSIIYKVPAEKDSPSIRETIVNKRPVYVVYPNYTLPDLSFLNIKDTKLDNVALKPQCYDKSKAGWKHSNRCSRPFSCNDIDALKQRGFSHVKDWESLTFLLPTEYKKILHDVPEVSQHININEQIKKPLFCLSPPMRHKTRPISELIPNNSSSTSSTATQPSSGYRGSSTILTDSSTNQQLLSNNIANPLYLYRYDSISSEASLVSNDKKMHRAVNQAKQQVYPNLPKRSISLPYGDKEADCCNGKVPPRPPLPRSILRKNKVPTSKRYSMFEMGGVDEVEDQCPEPNKRMSLHEPYYMNNDLQMLCRGRIIDSEKDVDETEEKCNTERLNEAINNTNVDYEISQNSEDDVKQLEEFLKRSGLSSESSEGDNEDPEVKLRSYVRKFLALRMNKDVVKNIDMAESQKKTVSFALHERKRYSNEKPNNISVTTNEYNKDKCFQDTNKEINPENKMDLEEKRNMILSVSKSVDLLLIYWNTEPTNGRQNYNDKNECAQLCLSNLCPALYTIMSDGLKPHLQSTFGPLANSVWQVVEASAQQGPLTKTLNELVQKINGEDIITEGMLKFHAFVFGLLNLRALDAWFAYLCTRESILRKHYNSNSLFTGALGNTDIREIVDSLLDILHPLAFCPFQLDLLYQYRQLHNSFGNMNNYSLNGTNFRNIDLHQKDHHYEKTDNCGTVSSPRKIRPRSCVVYNDYDDKSGITHKIDHESVVKKRFNNAIGTTKVLHGLEKLASEDSEDYTDSLEHSPLNRGAAKQTIPIKVLTQDSKMEDEDTITGEAKFRKLQEKWESMVGKDESVKNQAAPTTLPPLSPMRTPVNLGKSKIPRLLTSPIKQPNVTIGSAKSVKSPITGIPSLKKPVALSTTKTVLMKPIETTRGKGIPETRRTSRVDQDVVGTSRTHLSRPSSLPYKSYGVMSKEKNLVSPQRRAASTSLPRPNTATRNNISRKQPLKDVRTVTNRAPSNNGHLSFAEGERLKVILEIDNKWLLCERGDRKGLVPRMCVHTIQT